MGRTKNLVKIILTLLTLNFHIGTSQLENRKSKCTFKQVNNKLQLICSGYPSVPSDIKDIEDESFFTAGVLVLDMSNGNSLQSIKTQEFEKAGFGNLDEIKLSHNQIRTIEHGAFRNLNRLMHLDLSNNKIDTLDMEAFDTNEALAVINLRDNPIHQFKGEMFPSLPSLRKLDLSDCMISTIPKMAFSHLSNLQELNLQGNQIKQLDWDIFKNVSKLNHVTLSNNPWYCDCHVKFLQEYLRKRMIAFPDQETKCAGPTGLTNKFWDNINSEHLKCPPKIVTLAVMDKKEAESPIGDDYVVYTKMGMDIAFECVIESYPPPEIIWLKGGKELVDEAISRGLRTEDNADEMTPHIKFEKPGRSYSDENEETYNYLHRKLLRIYRTEVTDFGEYTCFAFNPVIKTERDSKKLFLNFTNIPVEIGFEGLPVVAGGSKWWIWIIVALLILILIVSFILCWGIWKRRENKKQKVLKQQMLETFKNSHDGIDGTNSNFNKRPTQLSIRTGNGSSAPLLSPTQSQSETPSHIPDVAKGNPEYVRSLSPEVFSPRPMSATDLRRQFFARQMSQAPVTSSRPGSAMSLSNIYYDPNNRRQQPMHQQYPGSGDRQPQYPMYLMHRPGSAASLMNPHLNYYAPRPVLTRQLSGPAYHPVYATMSRLPPRDRRPPSVSSFTSEPPPETRSGFGYVTLPRGFAPQRVDSGFGRSLSPTESMYSSASYSTLPRRPRINPSTGVPYDSVGPRTTVDGGSNLSLNRIGDTSDNSLGSINYGVNTPTKGKVKSTRNRSGSSTTPGSIRGRGDFFSFEPIQEVEGSDDVLTKQSSNQEIDNNFPTMQSHANAYEPRFKKKKPSPIVSIPPKSRKPIRNFEYAKIGEGRGEKEEGLGEERRQESPTLNQFNNTDNKRDTPPLPMSPPPPKPQRLQSSIENIYDEVLEPKLSETLEGTEV